MALQIWLPLNGDLTNNGLTNANITNSNATVSNNGKIGKCYSFNGNSQKLTSTFPSAIPSSIGTLACWVKFNAFPANGKWICLMQLGTSGGFAACRLGVYMEYTNGINICIDGSTTAENLYTHSLSTNTWYHLCATNDGTNVKLYLNGDVVLSKIATKGTYTTSAPNLYIGGTNNYYLNGCLNDVRYYDTCLSPKEVEVLARGLVVHYPMTGGGKGQENILIGTMRKEFTTSNSQSRSLGILYAGSGGNGTFSVTDDTTVPCGSLSWNVTNNTYGNRDFQQAPIPYISGNKYTASWWAKGNGTQLFRVWNQNVGGEVLRKTWTLTTNWTYYTHTFTANDAMQNQICTWHLGVTGSANINICGMKLELGDKATPWTPNSADICWNPIGYNNNTEYDTSGYLHNGTINGSASYSSDTARYSVSTEFSKAGYINIPSFNVYTSAFTLNFWVKMKTATSQHFVIGTFNSWTGNGIGVYRDANAVNYQCIIRSAGESKYGGLLLPLTIGSWYMLTLTYDGANYKGYLNGVLKQNVTYGSGGVVSNPVFMVGNSKFNSTPASENEEAFVSDVRFYATCLDQEAITKLYNTSASIANNGALLGYEFVEV